MRESGPLQLKALQVLQIVVDDANDVDRLRPEADNLAAIWNIHARYDHATAIDDVIVRSRVCRSCLTRIHTVPSAPEACPEPAGSLARVPRHRDGAGRGHERKTDRHRRCRVRSICYWISSSSVGQRVRRVNPESQAVETPVDSRPQLSPRALPPAGRCASPASPGYSSQQARPRRAGPPRPRK